MNLSLVLYIIGSILQFEAGFMLLPSITGLIYGEYTEALTYLGVAVLCLLCGFALKLAKPKNRDLYMRDGFAAVALSWIFISAFGAFPFVATGEIPNYIDALFEASSGFTTTGASILSNVEALSHASLFWRSFTHWIGGMGVFVFIMAILPMMGASTMNLMKAESTGPSVGKLVPRVKDTAKILYGLYIAMTIIGTIVYLLAGMNLFEALTMIFGTVGTGGFGIYNDSIASFTPLQQNMITLFMILSGVNYSVYFCIIRGQFKEAFSLEEVKWYFIIIFASAIMIAIDIRNMYPNPGVALRHSFFQVGSIITTTGYSTVDFDMWSQFSKTILVMLMFIGACAGSTGGGIKVSRILILLKSVRKEVNMMIHPHMVKRISVNGKPLQDETLRSTNVFIAIYFVLFFISVLIIGVDELDFTTNFTAVAATINNIGPGLNAVGPSHNFALYSDLSKLVLIFNMLAGRLELFPMLIIFAPSCWKKY